MSESFCISKKLSGYKQQDKKHEIFSDFFFITEKEILDLFSISNTKCTYCLTDVKKEYTAKDPRQWTLDRIDNRMGHNRGNVVLSCLQCNLKRGNVCSSENFRFTKQLQVVRCDNLAANSSQRGPLRWNSIVKHNETIFEDSE